MKYGHGIRYSSKNDEGSNPHCFLPSGFAGKWLYLQKTNYFLLSRRVVYLAEQIGNLFIPASITFLLFFSVRSFGMIHLVSCPSFPFQKKPEKIDSSGIDRGESLLESWANVKHSRKPRDAKRLKAWARHEVACESAQSLFSATSLSCSLLYGFGFFAFFKITGTFARRGSVSD